MNRKTWSNLLRALLLLCAASTSLLYMRAQATTADISNTPMGTRSGSNVAPNLMFILDDSGSMDNDYLPDAVGEANICRTSAALTGADCQPGMPPFYAFQFNSIYYNPATTYGAGVTYLNATLGNATPTAARTNPFAASGTVNVATQYRDIYWCLSSVSSTPSAAVLADTAQCVRNGVNNGASPFDYGTAGFPNATFSQRINKDTATPHYYTITPREYCTDETLITCTLSAGPTTVATVAYNFPAPVRWCRTAGAVATALAVSGNSFSGTGARDCQALTDGTYNKPRFGTFTRININTGSSYPRATTRSDCSGAVGATGCTDAEELQNFANWYSYYNTRLKFMKTVSGRVFGSIGNDPNSGALRMGFLTINASSSARYLKIDDFKNNLQRQNWFTKIYGITTTNSTPLREALSRVGRHFAGITSGLNSFMPDEPMIASCQRNYAFLVTDGYWNGNAGQDVAYTGIGSTTGTVGDQDDISSPSVPIYVDRAKTGTLDAFGTTTTTVTPNTIVAEALCIGNGNATFSTPATTTPCGCTGNETRRVQRTSTFSTTVVAVDGGATTTTNGTVTQTYAPMTACTTPTVITNVTPITLVEEQVITGAANSTFTAVNGVAAGINQAGVCPGGQRRVKQRTTTYNSTVITTDGVAGAATFSGTAYAFANLGSCVSVLTTVVTPVTVVDEQVVTGPATSTFAAINGVATGANQAGVCPGAQRRIKRRTTTYNSTVITTDGVAAPATFSGTNYAFADPSTCISVVTTVITPVTVVEQQVLIGSAASTFAAINGVTAGANAAGVCTSGQRRVKQRNTTYNSTVVTTDGVAAPATFSGTNYAFSNPGSCISVVTTVVTPITVVEEEALTANATSTFALINGLATGANQAGVCSTNQSRIKRRTTAYNSSVVTTDGVAAPATLSGTAYAFANPGSCVNLTNTVINPVVETRQWVTTSVGTNLPTLFAAPQNSASASGNPQTTFTCTGAGNTAQLQRVTTYNRTVVTIGTGAPTTTFSANTASPTFTTVQACSGSGKTAAAVSIVNNAATSNITTGAPVPAATTTTPGTPGAPTTVGTYPTAAATTTTPGTPGAPTTTGTYPTAAATTTTPGTPGAPTTVGTYPTAAANTNTPGVTVSTSNGGTTLTIVLSPNPTNSAGTGVITTAAGGSSNTLADVAMYYYKTDLRTTGPFAKDNVPVDADGKKFIAPHQHMITFTMGLGLDGLMTYRDDYESATTGDFFKIKSAATNCIWTTGTCNWPIPAQNTATAIDDLWHAAVNGRGKYFSARQPVAAESGIKETLAAIDVATGSAAAAATSTPNLTTTNNSLYSSTYRTVNWDGEIVARTLDPSTGLLTPTPSWTAATQLNAKGLASSDTRTIYTFDGNLLSTTKLKSFVYTNLTATEQAYFNNQCTALKWNQCTFLASDATRLAAANTGANLIDWLRGQRGNELSTDNSTGYFRRRENLLGDTVNSKPAYMAPPELQFQDVVSPTYETFKTANATRQKVLFVAANDGMLHAFNADTGAELWAYIPKMILPNLYKLANTSYSNAHAFFVDGSPTVTDVFLGGAWKTVLVGGLNSGGRGYFALDVTDPSSPKALWEVCSDPLLCAVTDTDMGLSYTPPVIGKRPADGKWVVMVASGYNNIGPGNGGGYLYMLDLATGAVLEKVGTTISGTNVGDTTTPNGFAKITAFVDNFISDNTMKLIYGGDLLGNMWRFDLATSPPTLTRIAQLKDGSGKPQSVTTRPDVTKFTAGFNAVYVGTGRFLGDSDLGDPALLLPAQPYAYQQSVYAFKDTNADLGDLRLGAANLVTQSLIVVDAANRSISNNAVNWTTNNGWYVDMNPVCVGTGCSPSGESPGERINLDVQLVRGTVVVLSNEPNADTCSTGGDSFLYQFNYASGSYITGTPGNIVGTKIGNTLAVGIVVFQTLSGQIKSVITTADGKLPTAAISTSGAFGAPTRAAWRELLDDRTSTTP